MVHIWNSVLHSYHLSYSNTTKINLGSLGSSLLWLNINLFASRKVGQNGGDQISQTYSFQSYKFKSLQQG